MKSRKWSTFAGSNQLSFTCVGSIWWPGLLRKGCFLALSILHLVRPGMKLNNSDLERSQTKMDSICCLVYKEFAPFRKALLVLQEADYLAGFHPLHYCTSPQHDEKAMWIVPAQLPPELFLLLSICSSDLLKKIPSMYLYKVAVERGLLFCLQSSQGSY